MRGWLAAAGWGALLAFCAVCFAQQAELQKYAPGPLNAGVIRSWGDAAMQPTMIAWEQAFHKYHPEIGFSDSLQGTATSMAGIITGVSDLSLMGRPVTVNEVIGFEWVHRTKPLGLQVMNGGLGGEGKSPSLAVFVSSANPIQQISLKQLAAMLQCPVAAKSNVTWAMAGAAGQWANRPVHAYLYDDQTGSGSFLQRAIQGPHDCWNWDIVREFKDKTGRHGKVDPAGHQIMEALREDPDGIAISTLNYAVRGVKTLAVSGERGPQALTTGAIVDGTYPLARGVYIYIERKKDQPVDATVAEFLRFILSREGQAVVDQQHDYLPLNPSAALAERRKLE